MGNMGDTGLKGIISNINFYVIWRERCARSFAEIEKGTDELLQETVWQLDYYTYGRPTIQ